VLKKQKGRYTKEFRAMAVGRMKVCSNITALAQELGIPRVRLYQWREAQEPGKWPKRWPVEQWESPDREKVTLQDQLQQAKQLLAEKALEVDFLKGALHRIEARRQGNRSHGGTTSTSKSSK
jgi:hypothetical protein